MYKIPFEILLINPLPKIREVKISYIYPTEYYESIIKNEINLYVERVAGHCKCEEKHVTKQRHSRLYSGLLNNKFESCMYECVYVYTYGCTYVYVCTHIQTHNFIER